MSPHLYLVFVFSTNFPIPMAPRIPPTVPPTAQPTTIPGGPNITPARPPNLVIATAIPAAPNLFVTLPAESPIIWTLFSYKDCLPF